MEKSKALKSMLQAAINDQKKRLEEIRTYYDFLKGKQYSKPKKNDSTFNICHTNVQVMLDTILRGKSHIYLEPITEDAVGTEDFVEKVINEYWVKLKIKNQLKFTVTDYAASGLGITYTDWDFETDSKGKIINDDPIVLNIPYKDFFIDPEFVPQEIMKAGYMIRKFIRPTKALKADSRYKHTSKIKGDVKLSSEIYKDIDSENSPEFERTTLYQIWIPDDQCSYVLREGSEDILREVENKFGREYPFILLQNYTMPEESFPYGDVKILYEPQKYLNKILSSVLTHTDKVSKRQYTANSQISKEELRKLKDAEDGEVLQIEGNAKAGDVISPIQDAALSVDVYKALELVSNMVTQLSRISEYSHSVMPQKERKATEANYVQQGTEISTTAKYEDVQEHGEEIARKIFILLKHPDNIETRYTTYQDKQTGQYITKSYNFASFPGEHSYRWESGLETPVNMNNRQQKDLAIEEAIERIAEKDPNIAQRVNWMELLRTILGDLEAKNIEQILTPEEPIMGQGFGQGIGQPPIEQAGQTEGQIEGQTEVDPQLMNLVIQNLQGQQGGGQ